MGEKQKEKWEKKAREKETPSRFLRLGLLRIFTLFGRLMKTLVSQRLEIYVVNSLLLCSARHDLNKMRKSKSWMKSRTKGRRNVSTLLEAFLIMAPFALRHRFPKTFQPYLAFFKYFTIFSRKIKLTAFFN